MWPKDFKYKETYDIHLAIMNESFWVPILIERFAI